MQIVSRAQAESWIIQLDPVLKSLAPFVGHGNQSWKRWLSILSCVKPEQFCYSTIPFLLMNICLHGLCPLYRVWTFYQRCSNGGQLSGPAAFVLHELSHSWDTQVFFFWGGGLFNHGIRSYAVCLLNCFWRSVCCRNKRELPRESITKQNVPEHLSFTI